MLTYNGAKVFTLSEYNEFKTKTYAEQRPLICTYGGLYSTLNDYNLVYWYN